MITAVDNNDSHSRFRFHMKNKTSKKPFWWIQKIRVQHISTGVIG
jgi:hypothetical protein